MKQKSEFCEFCAQRDAQIFCDKTVTETQLSDSPLEASHSEDVRSHADGGEESGGGRRRQEVNDDSYDDSL